MSSKDLTFYQGDLVHCSLYPEIPYWTVLYGFREPHIDRWEKTGRITCVTTDDNGQLKAIVKSYVPYKTLSLVAKAEYEVAKYEDSRK